MTLDFTLKKYAQLCEAILQLNCPIMTVRDFLQAGHPIRPLIVLRHDVDRQIDAALQMAELENRFGIRATYYIRKQPSVFKATAIKYLNTLGHEIGYHYEVLAKTKGDVKKAIRLFDIELRQFREIVPVSTISMHGSPMSPWNNLNLWTDYKFSYYDVAGDAVLSVVGDAVYYFTDTGRAWDADRYNLRDSMKSISIVKPPHTTDDLIRFLQKSITHPIFINAHPNRWQAGLLNWGAGLVTDWVINQAKWLIALVRANKI